MPTVQVTYPAFPKLLDVVNRVLRETGAYTINSLNPGNVQSTVVLDAINDGIWQIYNRERWAWAIESISIPLVNNLADYPLPGNFDRMAMAPIYNGLELREWTLDEWNDQVQPYVSFQQAQAGSPAFFKISPAVLTVYPAPVTATIAVAPNITFSYYRNPGTRFDNTNDAVAPNLPVEFVDCLVTFGKWRFKMFLEYPDAQAEAQRFEQLLATQMNRNRRGRKPNQMRQVFNPAMITNGSWY